VNGVIGREAELGVVERFLDGSTDGHAVLAIVGEPGIGKTTIWDEAVARARAGGTTVLAARPAEPEAKLSFAGLADLLAGVPEELYAAIPEVQREALEVALLRSQASRPPGPRVLGTAFLSLLRQLADERAVVVAVDDFHWLDRPSTSALEFALRRLPAEQARVILSVRSGEVGPLVRLEHDGPLVRLELGPLSVASLHRVVSTQLGRTFPRPMLVRIAQASGGNPLYALEIARLLERDGERIPVRLPVPESLQALVASRIRSLPAGTRDALLRTAALAQPDLRLVDGGELAAAEEAGLVRISADGRIEFVHPLFASAVYSSAPLGRRRETHRALADAVRDPEERARHLALGCEPPDERVARAVEAAARGARLRGAPDTAAELTELALRLLPEEGADIDALRLDLAEHLYLASDFHRSAEVLERLRRDLGPGDLRARALLILAEIDYWRRGESAATALAEEGALAALDPVVQARCQAAVAMYAGTVDLAKAADAARAALALLDGLRDAEPGLVAAVLSAQVRAGLFLGEGFDAQSAERALALERSAPPAAADQRVVFKLGQWLRYVDDLDGARAYLAQAEQAARDEGDESSLANILLNRMIVETWAGEWGEAEALAERMADAFAQQGVESEGVGPWRAYVDAHVGRFDVVRAAFEQASPGEPIVAMIWNRCVGLAALAAGEGKEADRHLSQALAELARVDFREPAIWRVDGDAIEAAITVGELERAEHLLGRFEERAARSQIPWSLAVSSRCRGLLHAARGDLEGAAASFELALAEHGRCPMPFELARTLLARGRVLRRLKRKRQARASLEEAEAIFRRLGAEPWLRRTEDELARVAVRRAPDDLSATELRIARLAAAGRSNAEIAAEVFVSRKTVEANLARVYRKLDIRSRAQLSRALDEHESSTTESAS
jgi:DNA-binding CsgD family transcriptional regulator/RecA/RadA recombinase